MRLRLALCVMFLFLAGAGGCFLFPTKDCDSPECMAPADLRGGSVDARSPVDMAGMPPSDLRSPDLLMQDLKPECGMESDCAGGMTCVMNRCAPCTQHADCASQTCDVYQATPRGNGKCLDKNTLIYVDNKNGAACTDGLGGQMDPVCSIASAFPLVGGAKPAIRVVASTKAYDFPLLTSGTQVLYGPAGQSGGKATLSHSGADVVVLLGAATGLTLDGFEINGSNKANSGVNCTGGASMTLHRSEIDNTSIAVQSDTCPLELDRVLVTTNKTALFLVGSQAFTITNSFIINNAAAGSSLPIDIEVSVAGKFQFNTVAKNTAAAGKAGLTCSSAQQFDDSIIVQNAVKGTSQFDGVCTVGAATVIGKADTFATGVKQDPKFANVNDVLSGGTIAYGLDPADTGNQMYLLGQAVNTTDHDYFGTKRSTAGAQVVGAHEAK